MAGVNGTVRHVNIRGAAFEGRFPSGFIGRRPGAGKECRGRAGQHQAQRLAREIAPWLYGLRRDKGNDERVQCRIPMVVDREWPHAVGLNSDSADAVHPERLRKLAREGGRFTAQHLRTLSPLRRRATLVATVLDTSARLTDDGVALFDRAVGRMFRRAEAREEEAVLRNARAVSRCCTGWVHYFSARSDFARCLRQKAHCARSSCLATLTMAAAKSGRTAFRPASSVQPGAMQCAMQPPKVATNVGLGRRLLCWRCAIGSVQVTSGLKVVANGAPSKIN